MPLPKDPQKLKEYKEKLSRIAKEKGFGKWMKGKKLSDETVSKMSQSQKELITPEECQRRSERAKELGYGKWMLGKAPSEETREKLSKIRKGKTYSEIYGPEIALIEAEKRRIGNMGVPKTYSSEEAKDKLKSALCRKGKTYQEIYGDKAEEELQKRKEAHLKRWEGKARQGCRDKKNGEHLYIQWRKDVFLRDMFTCQYCGYKGSKLQAHHIKSWSDFPEYRYDVTNGITLCMSCHAKEHPNVACMKKYIIDK